MGAPTIPPTGRGPASGAEQRAAPLGPLHGYLAEDHARLDALLLRAVARLPAVDADAYAEFRAGLLRHIAMEEKVLLPAARRARGGDPLPIAKRLRAEHGALASLLVPTPTPEIVAAIRGILADHNRLEEEPDGLYATCERLAGREVAALLEQLRAVPDVPVAAHCDEPRVHEHVARLLRERAGRGPRGG